MDDLTALGVLDAAEVIRRREVSPVELTMAVLDAIEAHDGELHAFVTVLRERALREAAEAEREIAGGSRRGPLHGVPYAVKDLFDVAGESTSAGCHLLDGNVADRDASVVRLLSEAGMVLIGKTHTVQFAYGGVGINHDAGTPRNPWRRDQPHVPGGSSSGSAVAVAARLIPVALGSDTSGSVRVPASLCGVTGLKTTVGRVSRAGVYPLSPTLDSVGPLARSVADCAAVYETIQGEDPSDASTVGQLPHEVMRSLTGGIEGVRLAFVESLFFDDADPDVVDAVRATADVFSALGAEVVSIEAPELYEVMGTPDAPWRSLTVGAEGCHVNRRFLTDSFDDLDPIVAERMRLGIDLRAVDFFESFDAWERIGRTFAERVRDVDAWLLPATMLPARPAAEVDETPSTYAEFNAAYLRNTSIGNRLRWCGPSVPCGFTGDGLPIGLMIQTPAMHEHVALRIAHAFQQTTDWHERRPF